MLNWLFAASKLHKHRGTCCTAEWPYCPVTILCADLLIFYIYFLLLIFINCNFDFLVLYKMYFQNSFANRSIKFKSFTSHLQHSHPCCIRCKIYNSHLRPEFVYMLIQHGRSCRKQRLQRFCASLLAEPRGFVRDLRD